MLAARDLLARVPLASARLVYDLGCGPGNSAELLSRRFPDADIIGLDASEAMLDHARTRAPRARFVKQIAIPLPLALLDPQGHALAVDVGHLQGHDLGHPQARAVGDAERGLVLEAGRGFEETRHLLLAQHDRRPTRCGRYGNAADDPHGLPKLSRLLGADCRRRRAARKSMWQR